MNIVPFTRAHARQAAEIHVEGQPGTFLTRLGVNFLTRMYEAIADSPQAFGIAVTDGEAIAGVAIVALDTSEVFRRIKRQHWHRLLWPLAQQILRDPGLIEDVVQSLRYPNTLKAPPGEAEILFLGLRRPYMRMGIAPRMTSFIVDQAHRRGCTSATTLVAKSNRTVRWIIAAIPGTYVDREIEMNGRKMLVYRARLPIPEDDNWPPADNASLWADGDQEAAVRDQ